MTDSFLYSQMDFIRLLYGLSLVLLAAVCAPLLRGAPRIPWKWFCLFGILYALRQWCGLATVSLGHIRVLEWGQITLGFLSFGALVQFARLASRSLGGVSHIRWIPVPLACASLLGAFAGLAGLDVSIRVALGLTGALWSAKVLRRYRCLHHPDSKSLLAASTALAVYGVLIGAVMPITFYHPTAGAGSHIFPSAANPSFHVVAAVLVLAFALAIRRHYRVSCFPDAASTPPGKSAFSRLGVALVCTTAVGWFATQQIGEIAGDEARQNLLDRARLMAAAIESAHLWQESAANEDTGTPAWQVMREQLAHTATSYSGVRRLCIVKLQEGRLLLSDGSAPEASSDRERTGEPCGNAPAESYDVFKTGLAVTVGPYVDRYGAFVSSIVPLRASEREPVRNVLIVDEKVDDWQRLIAGRRLAPLAVTLLIALLFVGSFVVQQISQESAIRLRVSEERLRLVLEATSEGIWDWNVETGHVYYSPRWCESLGYDPQNVPQEIGFRDQILHPSDLPRVREMLQAHLDGDSPLYECENRMRTAAGAWRDTLSRGKVVERDANGRPLRMVGADADITCSKQAETMRQQAEHDLRAILDSVHDAILVYDLSGRLLDFNNRTLNLFGVSRGEAADLSIENDLSSPENPRGRLQTIWQDALNGEPQQFEWIARRPHDGSSFPVEVSLRKAELADREVILASVRDITQRKVAEQTLRESEERLDLALRGADLGLWDWNVQTGEMHLDERWTGMLGYSPDEIEPHIHTWQELIHPEDAPAVMDLLRAHLEARTAVFETEYRLKTSSGAWVWVLARGRVMVRNRSGKPLRMTGTHLDITSHKQTEVELQEAKAAADAAAQTENVLSDKTQQETRS